MDGWMKYVSQRVLHAGHLILLLNTENIQKIRIPNYYFTAMEKEAFRLKQPNLDNSRVEFAVDGRRGG